MTARTDYQTQTLRDFELEQRRWLIANSKQVIADMRDRLDHVEEHFHSEARQRAMARYYRRQIEQETEFLRNEGVEA